ncbi:MAG: hypothetical protein H0T82_04440 [Sphingomonas sp.]|nr:hypothetical protein [Sphingomonas sp.]
MSIIRLNANIAWMAERGADSNHWIGICDVLGISTEADSLDELHGLIPEAIHLLMVDLVEDDDLDEFLQDRGWTASQEETDGDFEVKVPWFLVAGGTDGQSRHIN